MKAKKILVIQLRQLGDILLTTPCLRAIKEDNPSHHVTFLCHPMGKLVLAGCPYLDDLQTYTDGLDLQLLRFLIRNRFDMVLDFMANPRSAFFSLLAGRGHNYSFDTRRSFLYRGVVPREKGAAYIVREKFRLLRFMGFHPQDEGLVLPFSPKDNRQVFKLHHEEPIYHKASIRVALSPTHRREQRRWPAQRYAQLADRLVQKWQAAVVWLWGPGEEEYVRQVRELCTQPTIVAPATNFRELAALIADVDLFVGNSNGPSHVAVAKDTCSFQIHGMTKLTAWCPLTPKHRGIQADDGAIDRISLDQVWSGLEEMRPLLKNNAQ